MRASVPVLSVSRYEMTPSSSGSVDERTCSPGSRLSEVRVRVRVRGRGRVRVRGQPPVGG